MIIDSLINETHRKQENNPSKSTAVIKPPRIICIKVTDHSVNRIVPFQYSLHSVTKRLQRDILSIFPSLTNTKDLIIVPTFQKSELDLISVSPQVKKERDFLLENFYHWGRKVRELILKKGYWFVDITDPASGFPMFTDSNSCIYPDVQAGELLLRYDTVNVGCCKILLHPQWGTLNYPATLFTTAPVNVLEEAINQINEIVLD